MWPLATLTGVTPTPSDGCNSHPSLMREIPPHLVSLRECIMLMQVDISERAKVEATLAKLTESQVWRLWCDCVCGGV